MNDATAIRIMESIAANQLTIICGAGLSMAPPSSAPSAATIAAECAKTYHDVVGTPLPPEIAGDIEKMSRYFRERNQFDVFIGRLVPWSRFNGTPNLGHEAVADFLACGVSFVSITTNYDRLVEAAAQKLGEPDFQAIVDIVDLPRTFEHRPYLKVHGCSALGKSRSSTVWCQEQLADPAIKERMDRFRTWLQTNLLGRDVLIVGFWSDWAYLSEIFASTIDAVGPRSVILVDPSPADALAAKAPAMWAWANRAEITFLHERESGADFLNSLREHFSRVFLRQLFSRAVATYEGLFGSPPSGRASDLDDLAIQQLYALRRDLTGTPRHRPVRVKEATNELNVHSAIHARLLDLGAVYRGHTYAFGNEVLRLINGAGQLMSAVKRRYQEEPPMPGPINRTVCIGALADASPPNVIRSNERPSVIRGGIDGTWITEHEFLSTLGAANA
jgi:hypothetical protein